jgi:hypothetical protein
MTATKEETCEYIRDALAGMADMATAADVTTLAYILSMARLEAANLLASKPEPPVSIWD